MCDFEAVFEMPVSNASEFETIGSSIFQLNASPQVLSGPSCYRGITTLQAGFRVLAPLTGSVAKYVKAGNYVSEGSLTVGPPWPAYLVRNGCPPMLVYNGGGRWIPFEVGRDAEVDQRVLRAQLETHVIWDGDIVDPGRAAALLREA